MTGALSLSGFVFCAFNIYLVPHFVAPSYLADHVPVTILDTSTAVLVCLGVAAIAGSIIARIEIHDGFLLQLFIASLLIRVLVATADFVSNAQSFFGGDAFSYDAFGYSTCQGWSGDKYLHRLVGTFPWQLMTQPQSITVLEMLLWWMYAASRLKGIK
jgi:hypothetical protein